MEVTCNITINTENGVKEASEITERLQDKNLRRTRIKQLKEEPKEGTLSEVEWANMITVAVSSGFAATTMKAVFELLKGRLVDLPKARLDAETKRYEADTNKEVENARIESNERIERERSKPKAAINMDLECNGKTYSFTIEDNTEEERQRIMQKLRELEQNCQ